MLKKENRIQKYLVYICLAFFSSLFRLLYRYCMENSLLLFLFLCTSFLLHEEQTIIVALTLFAIIIINSRRESRRENASLLIPDIKGKEIRRKRLVDVSTADVTVEKMKGDGNKINTWIINDWKLKSFRALTFGHLNK